MPRSKYSTGLEGMRFNRTVIQSFSHTVRTTHEVRYYWNCLCDCGTEHVADARSMTRGMVQSCGCLATERLELRTKHGHAPRGRHSREFNSWHKMKCRVDDPKNEWAHRYSQRGITYCRGFNEFAHFLKVMGSRPLNTSIDRINNDGNYTCGNCTECQENQWTLNCRWATVDEQNGNKVNTIFLTYDGRTQPLFIWAKELGIPRYVLYQRFRKSKELALSQIAAFFT